MHAQQERSAFCAICPPSDSVAEVLASCGFTLTYMQPAEVAQEYLHLPPLPAQYHYEDRLGTQVLFLAGPDMPSLSDDADDEYVPVSRYPRHASRFWLIAGASELATRRVQEKLTTRWALRWQEPCQRQAITSVA